MGRWILAALGWHIEGEFPNLPKLVIIVAPHTSNWDFVVGLAAKWALGLRVLWLGKAALFRGPFGSALRALGGRPVDRAASHDLVHDLVQEFASYERLMLALAPEGTRKRVERWRTGFYHIARGANTPILPIALNASARAVQIGMAFVTTGDADADIAALQGSFAAVPGRR